VLKHNPHSSKPRKFEETWAGIKKEYGGSKININTLYYFCQKDNPDLYEQLKNETVLSDLLNKIIRDDNDGNFTEADYAELLRTLLGYKFCSVDENTKGGSYSWYEFIVEDDNCDDGQVYKWIKINNMPNKMVIFISKSIPIILKRIEEFYKSELNSDKEKPKEVVKHINNILKNLKLQRRSLGCNKTIANIIKLASILFNERYLDKRFLNKLDKYDKCLGVGNGILLLGSEIKLVTGFHEYIISKHSKVNYVPRSMENPFYEKLDKFFRSYYLDTEPDVLEFDMMFLASSLDFRIKDPVFFFKKGNGKNGKSTQMEFMKAILGDSCRKLDIGMLVQGRTGADAASPAKMQLDGARLVYYSESEKGEKLHVAKMKEFLGCETITGRKLHQDQVEFKPRCNHAVTSNHNFTIETKDHGTWRRIYYYEYKIRFVEEHEYDPNDKYQRLVDTRWISEYIFNTQCVEAFLNILTDCYKKYITYYDGKLSNVCSPTMEAEKAKYRNEQDFMNSFITNKIVYSPNSSITYEMFCEAYSAHYKKQKAGATISYGDIEGDIINSYLKDFVDNREIKKHRIMEGDMEADEMKIEDYMNREAKKKREKMDKRLEKRMKEQQEEIHSDVAPSPRIAEVPSITDGIIGDEINTDEIIGDEINTDDIVFDQPTDTDKDVEIVFDEIIKDEIISEDVLLEDILIFD
jgi:phage/plasmid-associated DNA primase